MMSPAQEAVFAVLWLIVLTLGGLVVLLYSQVDRAYRSDALHHSAGLRPGIEIPDFQILTTRGAVPLSLPTDDDPPYVLAFLNSGCNRCKDLLGRTAQERYSDRRTIFLLTHGRGYPDVVKGLPSSASLHPLAFPEEAVRDFGITAFPFVYVVRGRRVLAGRTVVRESDMVELLAEASHYEIQLAANGPDDYNHSYQAAPVGSE